MKTNKIASGVYNLEYKGYKININNRHGDLPGVGGWYFTYTSPNGDFYPAEDIYSTKKLTVESSIEWIDYLTTGVYKREILR